MFILYTIKSKINNTQFQIFFDSVIRMYVTDNTDNTTVDNNND